MMNVIDKWYLWQKKKTKWFQGYTCYLFKLFHACSQAPMLGDFIDLSTWTCLKINFYAPIDDLSTFCFWEHGTIVFNFTFINLRLNKPWKDFCNMCQNISSSGVTEIYLSLCVSTITCIELNPHWKGTHIGFKDDWHNLERSEVSIKDRKRWKDTVIIMIIEIH